MTWERRERGRSGVGLTPRQARFVDEYLIDLNATQAAIRAGYSAKTAQTQSSHQVHARRAINSKGSQRGPIFESLITNIPRRHSRDTAREPEPMALPWESDASALC